MASATSTLATLANSIITTTVSLFTTLITEYWPYVLVIGVVIALLGIFGRFVKKGIGGN
jgi:uncharacterized membrane protein YfcA